MIDQHTVDRIIAAADITEVVGDFVSLKKRGTNHLGLCPFHNEKTPSFTVSPAKGIFKCFGCGKGGNSVNFIMEHEHLTYVEALKYLAKKYHIEVVEKELAIAREKFRQEGKPEAMLDKIAQGALQKFFQESTLLNQVYVKDGKISIKEFLAQKDKELTVTAFERYTLNA